MKPFKPLLTAALSLVLIQSLSGCIDELDVAVTSEQGLVVFSVPKTDPPCVDRLTVYAEIDRTNPIWLIDAVGQEQCLTRFEYGKTPAGFKQRGPVEPLDRGKIYQVAIHRPGATGIAFFSPGTDGSIERDPPVR